MFQPTQINLIAFKMSSESLKNCDVSNLLNLQQLHGRNIELYAVDNSGAAYKINLSNEENGDVNNISHAVISNKNCIQNNSEHGGGSPLIAIDDNDDDEYCFNDFMQENFDLMKCRDIQPDEAFENEKLESSNTQNENIDMINLNYDDMAEVKNLLQSWNLSELYDVLKSKQI